MENEERSKKNNKEERTKKNNYEERRKKKTMMMKEVKQRTKMREVKKKYRDRGSRIFQKIEQVSKKAKGVNRILPPKYPFGAYEVHVEGIDEQIQKDTAQYKEEELFKSPEMVNRVGFLFSFLIVTCNVI